MVTPITYYGCDDKNQVVARGTAEDATKSINPQEVQRAVENLRDVFEKEMQKIATNLLNIRDSSDVAVIVKGAKITGMIEDIAETVRSLPNQILGDLDSIVQDAENMRNQIQERRNAEMYNAIASYPNVKSIR